MLESATQKIKISGNILTTKTFEDDLHHDRRNRFLGPCLVSRKKMKRKKKRILVGSVVCRRASSWSTDNPNSNKKKMVYIKQGIPFLDESSGNRIPRQTVERETEV
jgi:hypothetical protein